ncbi:YeeE/YedE thiosulfate transporter family protein [Clostridium sp. CF012]|uniref:YeeE/YedE thiosulfate transporter family protein n=1 Tax=Clostridium sp. CF012 TaxID=2843319 RepID=UPI001C0C9AF6|nr:YeeE/YedE thiosulfate transporter family protein [Clostridium sp. CF012]MBU3142916.1 YeeE/YedE family protein [Clostridium sp. CF012]
MSNDMDLLIQKRQETIKKQKNQIPYAIGIFMVASIVCVFLWKNNQNYIVYWTVGIGIGIALRYSRFCFSAALRDPFFLGNTKLFRGLLLALMISTIGFGVIQYTYLKHNSIDYGLIPGSITSVGPHIIIGAFMFGVGMVIAGGCASGVLMRIGEGHALHWVVLLGFLIGSTLGAKNYPFWYEKIISNTKVVYFPEYIDIKIVIVIQMIVLIVLYKISTLYENKGLKNK